MLLECELFMFEKIYKNYQTFLFTIFHHNGQSKSTQAFFISYFITLSLHNEQGR